MTPFRPVRRGALAVLVSAAILSGAVAALFATCGPFLDVTDAAFCPFIQEIFTLGITTGTTATTYDPAGNVSRIQMAAFLSRTVDTTLKRASRRAAVNRFWTPQNEFTLGLTTIGASPRQVHFDGADVWVANQGNDTVSRVRASDGKLLETWTGADSALGLVIELNRVFVTGLSAGMVYRIDPSQPAGAVTVVASGLGFPAGIAFDGGRLWTMNEAGSVSIISPATTPYTVTTVTVGTGSASPFGAVFDGANVWATDLLGARILKLNESGAVIQTVTVGMEPLFPGFDGTNLWVPNRGSDSVSVVRASNGSVLRTLTGNGLQRPGTASFDGERFLVTNADGDSVSLWKAADLTPLGFVQTGTGTSPFGACSDGTRFWITLNKASKVVRF